MEKTLSKSCLEFAILSAISVTYFFGITQFARETLVFELLFCIALPIMVYFSKLGGTVTLHPRILQLLLIESFFLLIVIASKISIAVEHAATNLILNYAFLLFFIGQTVLFLIYQYSIRSFLGMLRSLLLFVMLLLWFLAAEKVSYIDEEGRFLFWGGDASIEIQLYYCVWVVGVLLVDSVLLPNYRQVFPHAASVTIALASGEFFHSRLLTACHLFTLDLLFSYTADKRLTEGGNNFCIITDHQQKFYDRRVRKPLDALLFAACVAIFVYSIFVG